MNKNATINADRFLGFAETYDNARPTMPSYPVEIIHKYLQRKPDTVIDLGCGTGLSTVVWKENCNQVIGVEPSHDMLAVAKTKACDNTSFIQAFSHEIPLSNEIADVVICSQSFHWMNPDETLPEINRILKQGGIFATVDNDWPAVCNWEAELAYMKLFQQVTKVENENPHLKDKFIRWDKNNHLKNIRKSGFFRFAREIVFINTENCNADRFVNLALSQGGLQSILKNNPELIGEHVSQFKDTIHSLFQENEFPIDFCYRMRIGMK